MNHRWIAGIKWGVELEHVGTDRTMDLATHGFLDVADGVVNLSVTAGVSTTNGCSSSRCFQC
ncbi:MAG: hypothetical protein KDE58_29135 [Caldilineaceae bacterium]|nr:hypothetical protein [Caldilineaceae bacterium]